MTSLSVIVYREYTKSLNSYSRGQYAHKLTAGRNGTEDLRLHAGGKFGYLAGSTTLLKCQQVQNRASSV
jgi:hypothetical protein